MLASKMRWEIQRPDQDKVKSLTEQLHITPLVASLLVKEALIRQKAQGCFYIQRMPIFMILSK